MEASNGTPYRLGRLEGTVEHLDAEVDALKVTAGVMNERLASVTKSVESCHRELRSLREGQEARDKVAREEKKQAVRFQISTTIAIIMAILAAAAIVASKI